MRADRLLSLILLLQLRGRMTALDLAKQLEVSERTIYRDMEALSTAGVPIYAERGPGGGCSLLDSYRTTLTGLTDDEVQALFTLGVPAALVQLGIGPEMKAALLKIAASLPGSRQPKEAWVRQRIHLDPVPWAHEARPLPYLQVLHRAVRQDRLVTIRYSWLDRAVVEKVVEPYGLVAKSEQWYLVARHADAFRVYRVAEIVDACLGNEGFERRQDFQLEEFWEKYCAQEERARGEYPVRMRVSPGIAGNLQRLFGDEASITAIHSNGQGETSWPEVTLRFESLYAARDRLLALGGGVEVLEPEALRKSVEDFAGQILRVYQK